jgi:hypothetical protein
MKRRACVTGKRRHLNQGAAIGSALRCSRRAGPLRVYLCPLCAGWHLTSKPDRRAVTVGLSTAS